MTQKLRLDRMLFATDMENARKNYANWQNNVIEENYEAKPDAKPRVTIFKKCLKTFMNEGNVNSENNRSGGKRNTTLSFAIEEKDLFNCDNYINDLISHTGP